MAWVCRAGIFIRLELWRNYLHAQLQVPWICVLYIAEMCELWRTRAAGQHNAENLLYKFIYLLSDVRADANTITHHMLRRTMNWGEWVIAVDAPRRKCLNPKSFFSLSGRQFYFRSRRAARLVFVILQQGHLTSQPELDFYMRRSHTHKSQGQCFGSTAFINPF